MWNMKSCSQLMFNKNKSNDFYMKNYGQIYVLYL